MGRVKKIRRIVVLAAVIGIFAAFCSYAKDSNVIRDMSVKFKDVYGKDGDCGLVYEPEITFSGNDCQLSEINWSKTSDRWKPAQKTRVELVVTSDGKVFADHYDRTKCKVTGAAMVSAKAKDDHTLVIKIDYTPVVTLGYPEEAGWSSKSSTKAIWTKVPYTTGYQLNLYADDRKIKSLDLKVNYADLSEYMKDEAEYYYEVRAAGYNSQDKKYLKPGQYVRSEDVVLDDMGATDGDWTGGGYVDEKGAYCNDCWKLIEGSWYYFNGQGQKATGWLNMGGHWYYMDGQGRMTTGWQFINNKWYYLDVQSGIMAVGWVEGTPGSWYYLQPDGSMAVNTYVGPYRVDATGRWVQ